MSTTRFYRNFLLTPGAIFICAVTARSGIEAARAFEDSPAKTAVNQCFSGVISLIVTYSMIDQILRTFETMGGTGVWDQLTTKQKIAYSLLMLLAATGFGYSTVQTILGNTTTVLYGKGLPAALATFFAGVANNGALMMAEANRELGQLEQPNEASPLNSQSRSIP